MTSAVPSGVVLSPVLFLNLGLSLTIFREPFARLRMEADRRFWGFDHGDRSVRDRSLKITEYTIFVAGLVFAALACLMLLDITGAAPSLTEKIFRRR